MKTIDFGPTGKGVVFRDPIHGIGVPLKYCYVYPLDVSGFGQPGYWALMCWSRAPMEFRNIGQDPVDGQPHGPVFLGETRKEAIETLRDARYE